MAWWVILVVVAVWVGVHLTRRRRGAVTVSRSDPLSPLHGGMASKNSKTKKAALDAATQVLR